MRTYTLKPEMRYDAGAAFPAAQIAAATGLSPRHIRRVAGKAAPGGVGIVRGREASLISVAALPSPIKKRVEELQLSLNYRSPEDVIANPKPRWEPETPLAAQDAASVEYAHKLRHAMAHYIAHRNDLSFRTHELESRLAEDLHKVFGKPIGKRRAAQLAAMVLERDGGRAEFDRIEIYPPRPRANAARPGQEKQRGGFAELEDELEIIGDVAALSVDERNGLWSAALADFGSLVAGGMPERKSKEALFDFLTVRVPGLAISRDAMRKAFDRKLKSFNEAGVSGLCDKRRGRSGRQRVERIYNGPESLTPDENLLLGHANKVGGGLSQAFRELHVGIEILPGKVLQFSEDFRARYAFDPRRAKSQVPKSIRVKLGPLLKSLEPFNIGPKAARLASPSIHRDWSGVRAGDAFQSDDETSNVYVWFETPDGEYEFDGMRFDVLRPQVLPLVDVRTDYVLSIMLVCRRSYTSRDIRGLINHTCGDERIGLPRDSFIFEGGIWKARNIGALVDWQQIDRAFMQKGISLKMRHATTPRAKIIERIFSQEQNGMQFWPGYAGRNERADGSEMVRADIASMKRVGQPTKEEVAPWDCFLTAEQLLDRLQSVYQRFNNEPQNGERLQGLSPAEGWKQLSGDRPRHVLPDSLRFLLADEERPVRVTQEGIRLKIGNETAYFFDSERLAGLMGEQLIVRWNQDSPDMVVCVHPASDPNGERPFVMQSDPKLPALSATKEEFAAARASRKNLLDPQRRLFRMLEHNYTLTIRDELLGNASLRKSGEAHNAAVQAETQKRANHSRNASESTAFAARAGIASTSIKRPDRAHELESLGDLEARILEQEAARNNQ